MSRLTDLELDYRAAFLRYLPNRSEAALAAGYEVGRQAVVDGVSILDVTQVHHQVLTEVLGDSEPHDTPAIMSAAAGFLAEVLATFEMAHRLQDRSSPRRSEDDAGADR